MRAVHDDERLARETRLRGTVNHHAVGDERRQVAGEMDVENAVAVAGVARRNVEFDGRAGMIGRVINRRAQTAGAEVGGGGDDVGERHGGRAVKIRQRRAVAGAETIIAHAKLVARKIRRLGLLRGQHAGIGRVKIPAQMHHGFEIVISIRDARWINREEPMQVGRLVVMLLVSTVMIIGRVGPDVFVGEAERMAHLVADLRAAQAGDGDDLRIVAAAGDIVNDSWCCR